MIDERFCLASALGHAESVGEKFFDYEEVWCGCESGIERKYRSRTLQTVAWKVEFGHGMYFEFFSYDQINSITGTMYAQFCKCILTVGPFGALLIHM